MESNFNPKAAATTSSARGLYQFIDQTWLGTVKEAGAQLGYGKYADAISKSSSGAYSVNDPSMHSSVMKLRDDPDAASSMAAVLTQSNSFKLTGKIGRRPNDSELYMAHFMGVGGAGKLISNAEDNPNASAARMFPNAAAANRSIFYEAHGQARSVSEVYSVLTTRYTAAAKRKGYAHRLCRARRHAPADGGCQPHSAVHRECGTLGQRKLYLEHSRRAYGDSGHRNDRHGVENCFSAAARADVPHTVPGRRPHPADFAGGAGIVGQPAIAGERGVRWQRNAPGSRARPARPLQRPRRRVLELNICNVN